MWLRLFLKEKKVARFGLFVANWAMFKSVYSNSLYLSLFISLNLILFISIYLYSYLSVSVYLFIDR